MTVLRYTASLDNTITNAFQPDTTTRATGSNMGGADILEVFSIYGNDGTGSVELSRALIQFPIDKIKEDRDAGKLPASGSVLFRLRMYNAPHFQTTPENYSLQISAVSASWQEGTGLDMDDYKDLLGENEGSNWLTSSKGNTWTKSGGDYHASPSYTQYFKTGHEDIDLDVSNLVEHWIKGLGGDNDTGRHNYGFGIRLTDEFEGYFSGSTDDEKSGSNGSATFQNEAGATTSYYTKKFFARSTSHFFKQPVIEAQFNNQVKDDRGNFYLSSSLLTRTEIMNNLYFYNYYRGKLRDIAGKITAVPQVRLYYSSGSVPEGERRMFLDSSESPVRHVTASRISTGVYKATLAASSSIISATYPYLIDVWSYLGDQILTGSVITPKKHLPSLSPMEKTYVLSIPNLKKEYGNKEMVRFRLFAREKNWSPSIYSVAKNKPENNTLISSSVRVVRIVDDLEVVAHDYSGNKYSALSYDVSGNYFDFSMDVLEKGYQYCFKISIYDDYTGDFHEQPYQFKFRVI